VFRIDLGWLAARDKLGWFLLNRKLYFTAIRFVMHYLALILAFTLLYTASAQCSCNTNYLTCIITNSACSCLSTYQTCLTTTSACGLVDMGVFDALCLTSSCSGVKCGLASCFGCFSNYTNCVGAFTGNQSPLDFQCNCLTGFESCLAPCPLFQSIETDLSTECSSLGVWCTSPSSVSFTCGGSTYTFQAPTALSIVTQLNANTANFEIHWQNSISGVTTVSISGTTSNGNTEVITLTVDYDSSTNPSNIAATLKTVFCTDFKITDLTRVTVTSSSKRDVEGNSSPMTITVGNSSSGANTLILSWGVALAFVCALMMF